MQNDKFKFQTVANTRQMVPAKKSKKKIPNLLKKKILKLFHTRFFPLPSPLHFFFGSFLADLPFAFPLSSGFPLQTEVGQNHLHRCKTHMNSHQEEQEALLSRRNLDKKEAILRERNLTVSGNNNVHHQEVQNLQIKKTIQLMNNLTKRQHLQMFKMIPWERK